MAEDKVDELLQKLQKYFSHITASEIMNKNVITLTSERTLWQAKELMKIRKISGIPVVNDQRKLIGISFWEIPRCG